MADYYRGSITIGGHLQSTILPDFISVLRAACFEDLEGDIQDVVNGCLEKGEVLDLSGDEARFGHFDEVEQFCETYNIPFRAAANSYCEYPADVTYFDGHNIQKVPTDEEGCTIVPRSSLDRYMMVIEELSSDPSQLPLHVNSTSKYYTVVSSTMLRTGITDGISTLREVLSERFPDLSNIILPPLTLV